MKLIPSTRQTIIVVSTFIEKRGKYLLIFDPRLKVWRVPGGRLKPGEKIKTALLRKLKEELDVELKVEKFLGYGEDIGIFRNQRRTRIILYFKCKLIKGEPKIKIPREISKMVWLNLKAIKKDRNLEPAMKKFFSGFRFD